MNHYLIILIVLFSFFADRANAQYYNDGQDRSKLKWNESKSGSVRLIYPQGYNRKANLLNNYFEILRHSDTFGFSMRAQEVPVILHTENLHSNGVVVWAPRRIELQTLSQIKASATPWLKQLSAHEYRHVVQMSNLRRGITRLGSYLLGQQAVGIVSSLLPEWFMEGDATLAETLSAYNGRGLQPDFTIGMRMLLDNKVNYGSDKWFCGSYKDFVPDHYQIGYQVVNWSYTKYGTKIWDEVTDYTARHPYLIFTPNISLKRKYNSSPSKLLRGTLSDLESFWQSRKNIQNSSTIIPTPISSHTTIEYPVALDDSTIVAVASDFDHLKSLILINLKTNEVTTIRRVPRLNSRPAVEGKNIWWSEYRPSCFWEQKNKSIIYQLSLDDPSRVNTIKTSENAFFTTPTDEGLAWIESTIDGHYSIVTPNKRIELGDTLSIHGLSWDSQTKRFYYIGLSDCGIGIYTINNNHIENILPPSFVTIDDLRSHNGILYFTSTISGVDEAHCLNLKSGKQSQLSHSKYGSRSPYPIDNQIILTTYTKYGYLAALQSADSIFRDNVSWRKLPMNVVNPERYNWDIVNLDTLTITHQTKENDRRFRKFGHLFNVHSWGPLSYNPIDIGQEEVGNFYPGITIVSQSLLSNMVGYVSWGIKNKTSFVRSQIDWLGWAVKFSGKVTYGGAKQTIHTDSRETYDYARNKFNDKYLNLNFSAYLPINLSSGWTNRYLTARIDYLFDNSKIVFKKEDSFICERQNHKARFSLQYNNNQVMSYREFLPRWGYGLRLDYLRALDSNDFGKIKSIYAQTYIPGIVRHHSLKLSGAIQQQSDARFGFSNKILFPRGATYNFATKKLQSYSADYQFPLCYPDGGIPGVVYIKRIRLNLYYNESRYTEFGSANQKWQSTSSIGGDLYFDFNPLSRATTSTARLSLNIPNQTKKVEISFSVDMNF